MRRRQTQLQTPTGRLIIISGPSGSGKTTLHKRLLARRGLSARVARSVSVTTRPQRSGERPGRDYIFVSRRQFVSRLRRGYFLEWQKVFGHYYGTPHRAVERLLRAGKYVIVCIDVKGGRVVRRRYPDALGIFIKAPSVAVLRERLRRRATETPATLARRLAIARTELRDAKYYHYVVVNDALTTALKRLQSIIHSELTKGRVHGVSTA